MNITISLDKRSASMLAVLALCIGLPLTLAACDGDHSKGDQQDASDTDQQAQLYDNNGQRTHSYNHSQLRATLQDVEDYEAHGVATHSFMMNKNGTLNHECPSVGMPVHATDQLTNPLKIDWGTNASGVVAQMEKTGVFTGESSGTFVLCVRPNGSTYIDYWEGDVNTLGAPAHWDQATSQVVVDGDAPIKPTVTPKD